MKDTFLEAMKFRHACKEFDLAKKISEPDFKKILEFGRLSPSSFGFEPWKFLVIQNETLRELMQVFTWGAQATLPSASHFIVVLTKKSKFMKYDSSYIDDMLKYKDLPEDIQVMYHQFYEKFQKEDFSLLESERTLFDWASKQCYLASANMMTGAASIGIDSCPIEGFDIKATQSFLKEHLGVDTQAYGVSLMLSFGYRKNEQKPKSRLPLEEVVEWYT